MARKRVSKRRAAPKARRASKQPKLPLTKRVVTTTTRTQFGNADTGMLIDQAFREADDGDCSRVAKTLDRAQAAGANVSLHRKQLLQDCRRVRGESTGMNGMPSPDRGQWVAAIIGAFGVGWLLSRKKPTT